MGMGAPAPPSVGRGSGAPPPAGAWSSGREGCALSSSSLPLPRALQRPAGQGAFCPLRGSDPAAVSVSSGAPGPPARGPGLQPAPLAVQVSRLLGACRCKGVFQNPVAPQGKLSNHGVNTASLFLLPASSWN